MGEHINGSIVEAIGALNHLDNARAQRVIEADETLNQAYEQVHEACIQAMATQQPVASELRELTAEIQIAAELERIADHVADVGRIVLLLNDRSIPPVLDEIQTMADRCTDMLERMLSSYLRRDHETAKLIAGEDAMVDRLNDQVVRQLMAFMQTNSAAVENGTHLIWIVHNLERIADRITNIGEQVIYIETGEMVDLNRSQ